MKASVAAGRVHGAFHLCSFLKDGLGLSFQFCKLHRKAFSIRSISSWVVSRHGSLPLFWNVGNTGIRNNWTVSGLGQSKRNGTFGHLLSTEHPDDAVFPSGVSSTGTERRRCKTQEQNLVSSSFFNAMRKWRQTCILSSSEM